MKKILYTLLFLFLIHTIEGQGLIIELLNEEYVGFNDNLDVSSEEINCRYYHKLTKTNYERSGFSNKRIRKMAKKLVNELRTICVYDNGHTMECRQFDSKGGTSKKKYQYDDDGILKLVEQVTSADTIKYKIHYDLDLRPIKIEESIGEQKWISETADYSKTGQVMIAYYFSNKEKYREELFPFEKGFQRHIKSISYNSKKNKVRLVSILTDNSEERYITTYKLDENKNWITRIVEFEFRGKKYKMSKSKRKIKFKK